MADDDPLAAAKRVLASFTREEQRALRDFLSRRLAPRKPVRTALVASVKARDARGAVTYRSELVRCGKKGCRCEAAPCHGPYTYKYWREDGKLRKKYVGKRGWAADAQAP